MKISIVTVVLNAESVIGSALASAAEQDYENIEQIIIDGGSTDNTIAIIEKFKNKNFKIISEPDSGIYDAMNKGLKIASGDAILFLNADDRLAHPTAISDLAKVLIEHSDISFVFGDVIVRQDHSDIYRSNKNIKLSNIGFEPLCHQSILARKNLFNHIGTFDIQYRICADYDWLLRCVESEIAFLHVPRVVCWYATGGESDKFIEKQLLERECILKKRRTFRQRLTQRLVSALRRRFLVR